jgi:hypothetical protein
MIAKQNIFETEAVMAKQAELGHKLSFLDSLLSIGEEAYEIELEVNSCAQAASVLFFGWLMRHKFSHGAELLAQMVPFLFENVYLVNNARRRTLANAQKKDLQEIIALIEFNVTEKEWSGHLNPFDGLLLFYRFLDELGYPANLSRRERAIKQLRREIIKRPCPASSSCTAVQ